MVAGVRQARPGTATERGRPRASGSIASTGRRALIFVSGDLHVGCTFDVTMDDPKCKFVSLTSSGVSTIETPIPVAGSIVDNEFAVASGFHSKLREVVTEFNFGVVQVIPAGSGAELMMARWGEVPIRLSAAHDWFSL